MQIHTVYINEEEKCPLNKATESNVEDILTALVK